MLKEGDKAPDFRLQDDTGAEVTLKQFIGKDIGLYFYPKDDTPGCTKEACAFRDVKAEFEKKSAVILGVSKDDVASHQRFKKKHNLNFPLLSDPSGKMIEAYGVWQEKSLYGRIFMGIVRTTFVIDRKGNVAKVFPKVKVDGHWEEVLQAIGEK
ncbi:MAG: thioredoxin-dependent thiol peroxidase [Euryarchaeota archaeon]|nr:thioredoxin-dependent thiol peroxidase [Euryarchaeota archaeon]